MRRPIRIAVYADVNMNVTDGSSIWTQSVCLALAGVQDVEVSLILKTPILNELLLGPLLASPHINVISADDLDPAMNQQGHLTPDQVIVLAREMLVRSDVVLVRGRKAGFALARIPELAGKLWTYLTDIPQHVLDRDEDSQAEIESIAEASRVILCQTEELRSFLETLTPATAGKCWLLPPMIPDTTSATGAEPFRPGRLRLVYSGKFAKAWNTLEMCDLPAALQGADVEASLTMVGGKFNRDPDDPAFVAEMQAALQGSFNVEWLGEVSRAESLNVMSQADIGLSWRASKLNDSLELSTKVLEYCSMGTPPVLNRTPMHEAIFGSDYPLFADSLSEAVAVLAKLGHDRDAYARLLARLRRITDAYTIVNASKRLGQILSRLFPGSPKSAPPIRLLVISHDLKFFNPILQYFQDSPELEVEVDAWAELARHDETASLEALSRAEVVICEWCGPNAVFASEHKRDDQRLIVRLHRFELHSGYWKQVDIDAVDVVVAVSDHYRQLIIDTTGWPSSKVRTVPNYVDTDLLARPKMADARFHIGMIGAAPSRKRLDIAIQVVRDLRAIDPRYMLYIKSMMPWEYPWVWSRASEREFFARIFRQLREPGIAEGVVFDGFGADVAAWLRKIGFVLSTSDDESFHLAPAEGMASGAVPVIRPWPGATTIYDHAWIHPPEQMAEWIARLGENPATWSEKAAIAAEEVEKYDLTPVLTQWRNLIEEDLAGWTSNDSTERTVSSTSIVLSTPTPPGVTPYRPSVDFSGTEHYFVGGVIGSGGYSAYEPEVLAMLCALIDCSERPTHFLDIGANIGLFSLVAKAIFGGTIEVTAYEPTPELADRIRRLAKRNQLDVSIREVALSDRRGNAPLYLSARSDASNSLNPTFRTHRGAVSVRTETLDRVMTGATDATYVLKLDTESTEPAVLLGAESFLNRFRPAVVCEVLPGRTDVAIQRFASAHDYLPIQITRSPKWGGESVEGDTTYTYRDWLLAPSEPSSDLRGRYTDWLTAFEAADTVQDLRP